MENKTADLTRISSAQQVMRYGYFSGAPGVLVSGLVWLASGIVALTSAAEVAVATLFIGGMMIHPLAILIAKILYRPGKHTRGNPLGRLAVEGTFQFLLGLPLALVALLMHREWFYPAMLLIIGGRYLIFSTLYGRRIYWACGAALAGAGIIQYIFSVPFAWGALPGAAIEIGFAAAIYRAERTNPSP